mmetsp:Transcript_19042/g.42441  ORF Transcript_19042/g.42441 Transcript_19042/m.42441 type:complete len:306 (-) Transcript_19042:1325-2242(-)
MLQALGNDWADIHLIDATNSVSLISQELNRVLLLPHQLALVVSRPHRSLRGCVVRELAGHWSVGGLQVALKVVHDVRIALREISRRHARLTRPACAADAMAVGGDLLRAVVVDNVRDVWNVQASRSHICGHQYLHLAVPELLQRLLALVLRAAAVQHAGAEVRCLEVPAEGVSLLLRVDEYDDLVLAGHPTEIVRDAGFLLRLSYEHNPLLDALVLATVFVTDADEHGVAQVVASNGLYLRRHRGRKHRRYAVDLSLPISLLLLDLLQLQLSLVLVRRLQQPAHRLQHRHNLWLKTHIDHAISLV